MGRVKARWTKFCNSTRKKIVQAMQISRAKGFFSGLGQSGAQLLERVIGDFSFALWDAREEILFCARDSIGARPFIIHKLRGSSASAILFRFCG
jgi:asparagine synthetase B (glutamine-hydrolysing)